MARARFDYSSVILITGILTVLGAIGFARFGYTTLLPSMREGLSLNNTQMGMIASANFIGYTVFSLIGGFLASVLGPRIVISCGLLLTGAAMLLTGTAGGLASMVVLRFLTGVGSAVSYIPVMGLISAWFAPERRGMAAGFLVGGSGYGLLITGFLVPGVIGTWPVDGWRLSWFILGSMVVLMGIAGGFLFRNNPSEKGLAPAGGTEVLLRQVGDSASGRVNGPERKENKNRELIWSRIFASPELWRLGIVYLFYGFSYIIYGTFFTAAIVGDKGLSQSQAGLMWSVIGVLGIVGGVLWGVLSDRLGRKYAMAVVFSLQSASFLLFAVTHTIPVLYFSAFLYGISAFSVPGIVGAACGDYMGPRLAPAALGMVTLFFAVGQAAAPSVAGYLADTAHSFNGAFLLASLVAALGMAGSFTLRPPALKIE